MNTQKKIALFRRFFSGLAHMYGTYDPMTKQVRVVNQPVNDPVIVRHIKGVQSYGVFLLMNDRTRAAAVDFDTLNEDLPIQFILRAKHYGLPASIERSKSKGHHAWMFFPEEGVPAWKARRVARMILTDIEFPDVEIFPKQDRLDSRVRCGNFINAPLFGRLVSHGKTVFVNPNDSMKPYPDQWRFLQTIQATPEKQLDDILAWNASSPSRPSKEQVQSKPNSTFHNYGLPPCARRMLDQGVAEQQRVACFRLAVHLKRIGIPFDVAIVVLKVWALKNRPAEGKRIITDSEIKSQTQWAYQKDYRGCGCEEPVMRAFCDPTCPLFRKSQSSKAERKKNYEAGHQSHQRV